MFRGAAPAARLHASVPPDVGNLRYEPRGTSVLDAKDGSGRSVPFFVSPFYGSLDKLTVSPIRTEGDRSAHRVCRLSAHMRSRKAYPEPCSVHKSK